MKEEDVEEAAKIASRIMFIDTDMPLLTATANKLSNSDEWCWLKINNKTMIHCYERDILALIDYRQKEREALLEELKEL